MKRVVYASNDAQVRPKITFTPADVVEVMRSIAELDGHKISYEIRKDGSVDFIVNDMAYNFV